MAAAKKPVKKAPAKQSKSVAPPASKATGTAKAKPVAAKQDNSVMGKITGAAKGLLAKLPSADQVETAISPNMARIRKMGKNGS